MSLETELMAALGRVRLAARQLAQAEREQKDRAMVELAALVRERRALLLEANAADLERARQAGVTRAFLDRLALDEGRLEAMARGVEEIARLADPVGETMARWKRPNGLEIVQVRVPIGVIAVIFEARPNVTIDAGALCVKAGNGAVLRGGKEALATNGLLAGLIGESLERVGLKREAVYFVANPDREAVQLLKRHPEAVDVIIPRGGAALKEALQHSAVPLLPHFDGICHTYVDRAADLDMAVEICFNAKCSRPSVCNAMENLLVHAAVAPQFLARLAPRLSAAGVEIRGCPRTCALVPYALAAAETDWDTEYLDLRLAVKVVDSLEEAIAFVARHGSGLADAIVTEDAAAARRFEREVDSATVYVNASTRFTDGYEFGFGAETGISTNRLHARGPMGLRELTTYKYLVRGQGQVRR